MEMGTRSPRPLYPSQRRDPVGGPQRRHGVSCVSTTVVRPFLFESSMSRRWLLALGCLLVVAIVVIAAMPATRYPVLAWIRHEHLINDRPVAYWLGELTAPDPKARRQAALSLGENGVCDQDSKKGNDDGECQKVATAPARFG